MSFAPSDRVASQNTFSIDIGYIYTADGKYRDGLTYGVSIVETARWISFAIVARLFSNSNSYLAPDNQRKFEETQRDFL